MVERPDVIEAGFVTDAPDTFVDVDRMNLLRELQPEAKRMAFWHVCRI
jgi:hypothetical protein